MVKKKKKKKKKQSSACFSCCLIKSKRHQCSMLERVASSTICNYWSKQHPRFKIGNGIWIDHVNYFTIFHHGWKPESSYHRRFRLNSIVRCWRRWLLLAQWYASKGLSFHVLVEIIFFLMTVPVYQIKKRHRKVWSFLSHMNKVILHSLTHFMSGTDASTIHLYFRKKCIQQI